jgi:hypothetical protein
MGLNDRDYIRGKHPPYCTCVDCQRTPQEKPAGNPQKPPEITGAFDKSQFKRK